MSIQTLQEAEAEAEAEAETEAEAAAAAVEAEAKAEAGRDGRGGDTTITAEQGSHVSPHSNESSHRNESSHLKDRVQLMSVSDGSMLLGDERISHAMDVSRLDRRIGQQTLALTEAVRHVEKRICELVTAVQQRQDDRIDRLARDVETILGAVRDKTMDKTSYTSH